MKRFPSIALVRTAPVRTALGRTALRAALVLSVAVASPPLGAQMVSGGWDADERVIVTDFQRVTALARSPDHLYVATDGGLVIRDDAFERWELPITREDGYPASQVLGLGWDRRDGTLWLSTRDGRLLQLDTFGRRWLDQLSLTGSFGGPVTRILVPADDPSSLLLRQGERWLSFDPFTREARPAASSDVQRAVQADFDLRARAELLDGMQWASARAFLGRRGSQRYEITDVTPAAGATGEFWVATYGGFLEKYDTFTSDSEPVDYGVVGLGAAAVLAADERLWFAPSHASDRYGVAAADPALEEWSTWGGGSFGFENDGAPDAPIRAWLRTEQGVWAGGDRGLHRFDGERWHEEYLGGRGDVAPITSLAGGPPGLEGVWVGTERGLLRIPIPGAGPDVLLLSAARVRDVEAHEGALWVATDAGLVLLSPGEEGAVAGDEEGEAAGEAADPEAGEADDPDDAGLAGPMPQAGAGPPGRVGALATDGGRLYAGIERDLWVLEPGAEWQRAEPLGVLPARVTALAARGGVVWIGNDEGLLAWDTRDDVVTPFTFAGGDLPTGPRGERGVADLAIEEDGAVWAATPSGAVRLGPDW